MAKRIEKEIGDLLLKHHLTLAIVESCTAGLTCSRIVKNFIGSSAFLKGCIVAYSDELKTSILGVKKSTLDKYGAVSHETSREMAEGGRKKMKADICISITGIAGPSGGTPQKPVGRVYVGLSHGETTSSREYTFSGSREENIQNSSNAALIALKEYLMQL